MSTPMDERDWLTERVKADRAHLHAVAYRMLGSAAEAEDAVQEAWLRLTRTDVAEVENLTGWLTTVVARVCLDMLRAKKTRREAPLEGPTTPPAPSSDPEAELALASSVGVALLVLLETLPPAERVAFVLHDLFDLPFEEIASIVGRTPVATRQLASRARRRVRGQTPPPDHAMAQRAVVDAFLAAARRGDLAALVAVLDPDVVLRGDAAAMNGKPVEVRGASQVAKRAILGGARAAQPALIDGDVGVVVAPAGKLRMVLRMTMVDGKITSVSAIGDRAQLEAMTLTLLSS